MASKAISRTAMLPRRNGSGRPADESLSMLPRSLSMAVFYPLLSSVVQPSLLPPNSILPAGSSQWLQGQPQAIACP
jgi:hypothetical protein